MLLRTRLFVLCLCRRRHGSLLKNMTFFHPFYNSSAAPRIQAHYFSIFQEVRPNPTSAHLPGRMCRAAAVPEAKDYLRKWIWIKNNWSLLWHFYTFFSGHISLSDLICSCQPGLHAIKCLPVLGIFKLLIMLMRYSFFMVTLHWQSLARKKKKNFYERHLCFAYIFLEQWKSKLIVHLFYQMMALEWSKGSVSSSSMRPELLLLLLHYETTCSV